jgi:hypothetical protein
MVVAGENITDLEESDHGILTEDIMSDFRIKHEVRLNSDFKPFVVAVYVFIRHQFKEKFFNRSKKLIFMQFRQIFNLSLDIFST